MREAYPALPLYFNCSSNLKWGPHHVFAGVPAFKELEAKYLPAAK